MKGHSNMNHLIKILLISAAVSLIAKMFTLGSVGMLLLVVVAIAAYATF